MPGSAHFFSQHMQLCFNLTTNFVQQFGILPSSYNTCCAIAIFGLLATMPRRCFLLFCDFATQLPFVSLLEIPGEGFLYFVAQAAPSFIGHGLSCTYSSFSVQPPWSFILWHFFMIYLVVTIGFRHILWKVVSLVPYALCASCCTLLVHRVL